MAKTRFRQIVKVGGATTDWSRSVFDQRGYPAMGGAGWARFGQIKRPAHHNWVLGTLAMNRPGPLAVVALDGKPHADCSLIVIQRVMDEALPAKIEQSRALGQIIVNDLDDWFWGLHRENAAFEMVDPSMNQTSNIDHYKKSLCASTAVVTSTQFLADRLAEWNKDLRIQVIPNGVDAAAFPVRRHRPGPIVIGWAGSTAHRSGDLKILRAPFSGLSDMSFHHTGALDNYPQFAKMVGVDPLRVTQLPMLAPHEYPYGFTFDVGVVPLVDIPFNHAKSNIKGLEYAAAGIPFVASPLPAYVELAEEHGLGRLAKTSRDWQRHLRALADVSVRREESERQRRIVETMFTAKAQARAWDELIWDLLG